MGTLAAVVSRLELRQSFAEFVSTTARACPLWSRLSAGIVEATPGEVVIDLVMNAPPRQRRPVLFFAAVHDLLLADETEPLGALLRSRWPDPTTAPDIDPWPLLVELTHRRHDEILERCQQRHTQTNEASRAAPLVLALDQLSSEVGPISLIEIGSSAGFLLRLDRYRYRYVDDDGGETLLEGPNSPEYAPQLRCRLRSRARPPRRIPSPVERVGIDPFPVDVSDPESRRWLNACIWPDQLDRLTTLDAAVTVAISEPVPVLTGLAESLVPPLLERTRAHPVVLSSWAMTYLEDSARHDLWSALDEFGSGRNLSVVVFEDPSHVPEAEIARHPDEREVTALGMVTWRGGERRSIRLGTAHPHGFWFDPDR